jgi:hypothetical protein
MSNGSSQAAPKIKDADLYFKFKPCDEYAVQFVKDGKVWFSRLTSLNDPFEGDFTISDEEIKKLIDSRVWFAPDETPNAVKNAHAVDFTCTILSRYREEIKSRYYIFSVAKEKWSDILMWSHYAMNHRGVCIGLSIPEKQEHFTEATEKRLLLYNNTTIIHPIEYSEKIVSVPLDKDPEQVRLCRQKSPQWTYEREHRLIIRDSTIRSNGHCLKINNQAIKRVIFGARTSGDEIDKFIRDVDRSDIIYRKAVMKHGMFKLNTIPA